MAKASRAGARKDEQRRLEEFLRGDDEGHKPPLEGSSATSRWKRARTRSTRLPESGSTTPISRRRRTPLRRANRPRRARARRACPLRIRCSACSTTAAASSRSSRRGPDHLRRRRRDGDLKQEVRDTVGLMLQHPDDAERYGIDWNGILLHGPPGVGKTFFAAAIAGEYGLNLIHVSTGDLVAALFGGSAQNIDKAFQTALAAPTVPALLRRVRLRRAAARQHARPGVAPDRQPAADVARGPPRRAAAARDGGDELDRAPRSGRDPARAASTATSGSTCRMPTRGGDLRVPSSTTDRRADIDLDDARRPHRGDDPGGDREDRRHRSARGLPRGDAERQAAQARHARTCSPRSSATAARTGRPSSTGRGTRWSCRTASRRSCSSSRR